MRKRTITALILFAVGLPLLLWGGSPFIAFMSLFYVTAAVEFSKMFHKVNVKPNLWLVGLATLALIWTRTLLPDAAPWVLTIAVVILLAYHVWQYELGRDQAALDFAVGVAGVVYVGWVGTHLIQLRLAPLGGWWTFLVLMSVWTADTGAYMLGSAYGKHKMTKRVSPKKSWEGYFGGLISAGLMGGFLAFAFTRWGDLNMAIWQGVIIGLCVGAFAPLGDLGVSIIKRYTGNKDSGTAIPGHGGAFDRIDSWVIAGVIGTLFYLVWA